MSLVTDTLFSILPKSVRFLATTVAAKPRNAGNVPAEAEGVQVAMAEGGRVITGTPTLAQEMNAHDAAKWHKRTGKNGSPPFNNIFKPGNVVFNNGIMSLVLDKCTSGCQGRPYASGEYRSNKETFSTGTYEVRMKAAEGSGTVSSFFTYTGVWGKSDHYEIDFEFLGKDCSIVQTNYYAAGSKGNEEIIDLGFNACTDFHNYAFKLDSNSLSFYVDGDKVRQEDVDGSSFKGARIMVNLWPGTGVDGWLGRFTYPNKPIEAQYDWIRYTK
jgi:beta-glucanase (GH16 family)